MRFHSLILWPCDGDDDALFCPGTVLTSVALFAGTADAHAAGLIGRFGIGALAMLGLCKELRTTTKSITGDRTIVTVMDMTQANLVYEIAELAADGQLHSLGGETTKLEDALARGLIEPLGHTGTRVEATLKERFTGTQAEWDQLSRHEQAATGCQDPKKVAVLTPGTNADKNGVIDFLKLLFDAMKFTGTTVNVIIDDIMAPPVEELDAALTEPELAAAWQITQPNGNSPLKIAVLV